MPLQNNVDLEPSDFADVAKTFSINFDITSQPNIMIKSNNIIYFF